MKFHLSNLFNGRKALAEQEEASGEMNILKAGETDAQLLIPKSRKVPLRRQDWRQS